jgi:tetratricopeptide (TPR) repeat protein
MIEQIDHSGTEIQVNDKITRLVNQTAEDFGSAENWGKLGMTLLIHDFANESIPCFKKASSLNEKEFKWMYYYAFSLDEVNSEKAIGAYEKSRMLNSDYPPLLVKLGDSYLLHGELKQAALAFNHIVSKGIKVPHAHLGLAKIAIENDDLKQAEEQLSLALKMAPEYREAHALLAEVYRRKDEQTKAQQEFDLMKSLPERLDLKDPLYYQMVEEGVSSFWYQVRGNNYLNSGELNKAEDEFKKAIEAKPNESSYTSLGYVYQMQKRYEAALEQYDKALELNPLFTGALNNMAVIFLELGNSEKALKLISKALETDPESADGYLNLGTILKHQGKRKESIKWFRKGREIAPGDMRFAYQISWLMATSPEASIRDGKESLRLANLVCKNTSFNNPTSLDLLSVAQAENRQFNQALSTAQKAYALAKRSKNRKLAENINMRIELFKLKQPYRE